MEISDLSPEELEAILGTDYETVLAEALRRKEAASGDPSPGREMGQTYFDPGYAIEKYANRYRMAKDKEAAQGDIDKALAGQTAGRKAYAQALTRGAAPMTQIPQDVTQVGPPRPQSAPPAPQAPSAAPTPPPGPPVPQSPSPAASEPPRAGFGEPLRGPPQPGAVRPGLANASTLPPDRLAAAGVPPDVQALLEQLRRGR